MTLFFNVLPSLLEGSKMTILVFVLTLVISFPLGVIFGFFSTSTSWLGTVCRTMSWVIRGTPLLLQLIIVFFGFPFLGIIIKSRLLAVLIAFVINYTAYFAEIIRGGIQSIPKGQWEASFVLGLTRRETIKKIILPQVIQVTFPSIGNEVVTLVKDTSLIYALGLTELMKAGRIAMQREASIFPLMMVGGIYLIMTGVLLYGLKYVEKNSTKLMKRGMFRD